VSDTIQTVNWSLNGPNGRAGNLWMPSGHERPNEVLWDAIQRCGLEQPLRAAFQLTDPLWYGLWIDNPLNQQQTSLLHVLFLDVVAAVPRYQTYLSDFLEVLARASTTGEPLSVELAPPGHIDMGWVTTFVHCPRCKAEGLVERWQESDPTEAIQCPVCEHWYSPAATQSMQRDYSVGSLTCNSCGVSLTVRDFSAAELSTLEKHHLFEKLCIEANWLKRVAAFYRRYPDIEDRIKPQFLAVLESDDPEVQEELCAGVPFAEIQLPLQNSTPIEKLRDWSAEDLQVIEYLRSHSFSLPRRMKFVNELIDNQRLNADVVVLKCRACSNQFIGAPEDQS